MDSLIEIQSQALLHNYNQFKNLNPNALIAPVLKSNAYGHGLLECYAILKQVHPEWICLNYISEAQLIRQLGYKGRILIVGPIFNEHSMRSAQELELDIQLIHEEQLSLWSKLSKKPRAHLEIDTGLNRLGFEFDHLASLLGLKDKSKIVGVGMHFANMEDVQDDEYARLQLKRFNQAIDQFHKAGFQFEVKHASASAPYLLLPEARLDMCRLGISLYGLWPSDQSRLSYLAKYKTPIELKPVMSWYTSVAQVKSVATGSSIGYGCTYKANHPMKIAVLPVGYNEGFTRLVGDDASYVLLRGQRAQLVGRICMNMCMVDVTYIEGVTVGDRVTLLGHDGGERISAEKLASWADTIHYEFLTRIHPQVVRRIE